MSMKKFCGNCEWFEFASPLAGRCHLNPPAVVDSLAAYKLEKIHLSELDPPEGFRPESGKGDVVHQVRMFKVAEAASVRPVVRANARCSHYELRDCLSAPRDKGNGNV